eukprot:CAMPEP_0201866700 /NCGR_PEP_ID=MMETSP0902-20130614/1189_1 /ASSEMBLY_ACC=CAM_ASM_000551 /TAXON_ID=420261 /ORGANISM="Thalassiosira antarctica, Strain CCMP982" /LENGTH=197 /DNA_ID=CAMNT_0048391721 /DNA_START=51 /DNA_END=644 /DNA_ORIENTATION=-
MKTVILASLIAGAAAFAPAPKTASSVALNNVLGKELGAQAPLGFFDPLGLVADEDQTYFDHLREVEIRHGRVGMLAVTGWLTTAAGIRLPGMEEAPFGFKALSMEGLPSDVRGTVPLTLMSVYFITNFMQDSTGENEFPGDYRNGLIDFGWDNQTDEWKDRKRAVELNNGRAAQMGILGIMIHEQLGNLNDIGLPQP